MASAKKHSKPFDLEKKRDVRTWNAWELADAHGTVGKSSASSLEVSGSRPKSQGFRSR